MDTRNPLNPAWRQPGDILYLRPGKHQRQKIVDVKIDQPYINGGSARWTPGKGWRSPFEEDPR